MATDPFEDGAPAAPPSGGANAVGYGKPPITNRFKKGKSGNVCGRKKGHPSLQRLVRDQLDQRLSVTIDGKRQTVTKKEAIAMGIVMAALKNDPKAIAAILQIESSAERTVEPPDPNTPIKDQTLLDALKKRLETSNRLAAQAAAATKVAAPVPRSSPGEKDE